MNLLVINGPNLNMLGIREPNIYGEESYASLCEYIKEVCDIENINVEIFQSNYEGEIIDKIHSAYGKIDGIVINPAAYTHTSIAIMDALKTVNIPTVETHLSNIYEREKFRHISYIALACEKVCYGKGFESYKEAILYLRSNNIDKK